MFDTEGGVRYMRRVPRNFLDLHAKVSGLFTGHGLDPKIGKVKDKGEGDILEVPVDDAVVV